MSVATTNTLQDIGLDRIQRIKVVRRGPKIRIMDDSMSIAYFVRVHGHKPVAWDREQGKWTSTEGCDAYVCFIVELKP